MYQGSTVMKDLKDACKRQQSLISACWRCGGLVGHFHKECIIALPFQDRDKKDKPLSETNSMIGHLSYTLTTSTPITAFTIKAILKVLFS